jgi:hypothetical protein
LACADGLISATSSRNRTPPAACSICVVGLAELRTALDELRTGDSVVLQLERRGELKDLAFIVD